MDIAYSYIRFSSKAQELGDSLRRQVKLARDYAAQHDLHLDERSYQDLGISAFKGKNVEEGALGAFLKAVDDKLIAKGSYLLVESLDRVSRLAVQDAYDVFRSIIKRGIVLVTLQDGQVYSKATIDENWTKLIMALAVMARANEESATKAKRIRSAWVGKRERGEILTAMGPAWLVLSDDRKKWNPVPEKVKVVQLVFKHAAGGLGAPTIANILNKDGVPTMLRAPYWEPGVVMALLKNSSVMGRYTAKKAKDIEPIDGYYPVIVKPEVFHTVQEHIARRRGTGGPRGKAVANLFSGLLRCECGAKMRYVSATPPHRYVRCLKAYSNVGCDAPSQPYNVLETDVLDYFLNGEAFSLAGSTEVLVDPTVAIRGELIEKRKALSNLIALVEAGKSYAGGMSKVVERMLKLEDEIAGLEKAVKVVAPPTSTFDAVEKALELLEEHEKLTKVGGPELQELRMKIQAAMKRLISKIVLLKTTTPYLNFKGEQKFHRDYEMYGPVIKLLNSTKLYSEKLEHTADGTGVVRGYKLPDQGFHGSPKRRLKAIRTTKTR